MTEPSQSGWTRREFAGVAALVALAGGLPLAAVRLTDLPDDEVPSAELRLLMREVSQLVIPRSGTPGAGDVGAGDFALLALAHGLDGSRQPAALPAMPGLAQFWRPDGSFRHADWLAHELNWRAGGQFVRAPDRAAILARLDVEAFADGADAHPWRRIKGLILTGYYTSEIGGSRELRYDLVPGRWDSDIPATAQTVAFSSDWTAVEFG